MTLREIEMESIRRFLENNSDRISDHVVDIGCGKQPYRDLIEKAGGVYFGLDDPSHPGSVVSSPIGTFPLPGSCGTVVCTQVIQYVDDPLVFIDGLKRWLRPGGWILMTGPTNWPVVELEDKWRFTPTGVVQLLEESGFSRFEVSDRASVSFEREKWILGWQAVAQV